MIIIDMIRADCSGQRLMAEDRSLLVSAFNTMVEGREFVKVTLILHRPCGQNRYIMGVDNIKQYLITGDNTLFHSWNKKTSKRSTNTIKEIWEEGNDKADSNSS